jgi:hypothetical protein
MLRGTIKQSKKSIQTNQADFTQQIRDDHTNGNIIHFKEEKHPVHRNKSPITDYRQEGQHSLGPQDYLRTISHNARGF